MNKVTLFLAAALVLPATAMAQTPPQPPTGPTPVAPATAPHAMHHRMSDADMQAMMAKMKANMAKMEAAHKAVRAKILGSLTADHKAYFANLIGQLAVSTSPDWEGAAAKLNATLSTTEKSTILAIHADAMKQMEAMMPMGMPRGDMRFKRVIVTKNADGTTSTTTSESPGFGPPAAPEHPNGQPMTDDREMHMVMLAPGTEIDGMARMHGEMHMKHALTAGDILMHLAGPGESGEGMPMMMRFERFGHGGMNWKHMAPMSPVAPAAPAAAPTATP